MITVEQDMIGSIILGFIHPVFWMIGIAVIILHLCLGIYFACKKTKKLNQILTMPFLFISLHFAYGLGYIKGIFN